MNRGGEGIGPEARALVASVAVAIGLAGAPAATAQDAYTYVVRDAGGPRDPATAPLDELAFARDGDPMRVVQGSTFTWVVEVGDSVTLDNAAMILHENVPVEPGIGELLIQGWRPARVAAYQDVSVTFDRGDRDREVAGHPAQHYRLEARIERTSAIDGSPQRLEIDADLWVLPDVPHSWAPFGLGSRSLPTLDPRLRGRLEARLAPLGLVGRAVIHQRFAAGDGGDRAVSTGTTAFEIARLERAPQPPEPGPVVAAAVLDTLERRVIERPGETCGAVVREELPEDVTGVDVDARGALLATLNDACGSPEVYFGIVEERIEGDPGAVCGAIMEAVDADALAAAVFSRAERAAFQAFVMDADRRRFHSELRRYCQERGAHR